MEKETTPIIPIGHIGINKRPTLPGFRARMRTEKKSGVAGPTINIFAKKESMVSEYVELIYALTNCIENCDTKTTQRIRARLKKAKIRLPPGLA